MYSSRWSVLGSFQLCSLDSSAARHCQNQYLGLSYFSLKKDNITRLSGLHSRLCQVFIGYQWVNEEAVIAKHTLTSLVTPTPTILISRLLIRSTSPGRRSASHVGLPSVIRTMTFSTPARSPLAVLNISVLASRSPPVVLVFSSQYGIFLTALWRDWMSVKLFR